MVFRPVISDQIALAGSPLPEPKARRFHHEAPIGMEEAVVAVLLETVGASKPLDDGQFRRFGSGTLLLRFCSVRCWFRRFCIILAKLLNFLLAAILRRFN